MISAQKGRERDDEMSAAVCVCCVYLFCCKTHTHHPSRHLPQMRSDVLCHSRLYIIPSPGTGQNRLTFITLANPSFLFLFSFLVAHGFYFRSFFFLFSVLVCVYSVHVCPSASIRGTLLFPIRVNRKGPPPPKKKKEEKIHREFIEFVLILSPRSAVTILANNFIGV